MPESIVQLPADGTGKSLRTRQRVIGAATVQEQYVLVGSEAVVSFIGRAQTFRTPGRAGTTGQTLASIYNATGSTVLVRVNRITVDLAMTAAKPVTVLPPVIRVQRVAVLPTNGTALPKTSADTALISSASVVCLQDASADGASSITALVDTIPAGQMLSQEFAPRLITAAGYEPADRLTFFQGEPDIILRPTEGIVVELVYVLATQNPITDMWLVGFVWDEYQVP